MSVANSVLLNRSGRLLRFLRRDRATTLDAGKVRRLLLRLTLVVIGIGIGLCLCEVGMRAFHLGNTRPLALYNNRIHKLPPYTRFMNYNENRNLVETNNLGFHDRERQSNSTDYRILFLGDSFLEGRQVQTDSLFTRRLENLISRDGHRLEAVNGGLPSTGTAYQYVLWHEFFVPNVKIDHLILCFFAGNDLVDNNLELFSATSSGTDSGFFVDSKGTILEVGAKPGRLKRVINSSRDHSVLVNSVYETVYRMRKNFQQAAEESGAGAAAALVEKRDNAAAWDASEQGTLKLISRWKSELNARQIPFDIVVIDRPGKLYNKFELRFMDRLQASCAQEQIGFLRLKLAGDPYDLFSFDGIELGHFNDKGHETVANELYEYLQSHHKAIFNETR